MSPAAVRRPPQLRELGEFFRTRRNALDPADLGIAADTTRRRVSGLRREEVAQLASISSDYYTRIEQGRLTPSPPVLAALVRVLRLDDDQTDYAMSLLDHAAHVAAGSTSAPVRARAERPAVRPQLQRLLGQLTETPALVLGPRTDILAWNRLAERMYVTRFGELPKRELNYVRLMFTAPHLRELFADWPSVARSCVAILRREAVTSPDDPALSSLVGELTIADRDFGRWWAARGVARQDFGTKVLNHPEVGELTVDWDMFRYDSAPEQQLVLNTAHAGTPTEERLRLLMIED
ncbi:helix-turn-helix domain-containing protein [Microbacterium sp. No. 7]|uniref:helix-turn-helix domain-containing protein n=1 Tax=Microbacterium sp. No. 7 TaxID=1714373 RepID=UPI0006D1CA99|nr:helix-turn-helix domain-containing protein [Microbacterium sp. No. 7]ALJ19316.1 XRE family transcriptional regulator [Microbacterium sp. No. 7]